MYDTREALNLLKKIGSSLIALLLLPTVISRLIDMSDPTALAIALCLLCLPAYFIRERRLKRSERPRRAGGAERTPVLPRGEDEA